MFKKSRKKIVAAIMSILVLVWTGTLGIIYASSYFEMTKQNREMLQTHAEMYKLPQEFENKIHLDRPLLGRIPGFTRGFDQDSSMFQLSIFYSVAITYEGEILEIKNEPPTVQTDEDLKALAQNILETEKSTGTVDNLIFYKADKNGYTLVVFMDNTVVKERAMTLFRYTLIFGGAALVLFYFLSLYLAKKIVEPLEESYKKQKQFISDAGHELKTPISVVSANAELLSRELGENPWLSNIQYENERMALLVAQLLELARTEQVKPQLEQLDLAHLVIGEALPFESVAFEKGLFLNSNVSGNIHVEGNRTQLKQLVSILLDNAIQHSKTQGEVTLSLKKERNMARLSIINRGEEIPEAQREEIFERFYRIDTARNGETRHYGLGLAIAKAIVTAHKGQIEVLCYDGFIEFKVLLPISKK